MWNLCMRERHSLRAKQKNQAIILLITSCSLFVSTIVFTAKHKIVKKGSEPTQLEQSVAQALHDLETNVNELKADLRPLHLVGVGEVDVVGSRKAIVLFVPVPQLKAYHKIQTRLIRELEKKFGGKHFLVVAQRRILPKESKKRLYPQPRPRSRTLTAVHQSILEDIVYPSEIVGKRIRGKVDGSRTIKVFLDLKDLSTLEPKLDTFSSVYKKLTGKDVVFEFPTHSVE
jgi:small subunit ribosomal protein S7e